MTIGAVLELEDLHFDYGPDRPVLTGVDLTLYPGERLALAGGNGAGKTTLLWLVTGLMKPACGTIRAYGQTLAEERDFVSFRRRCGMLFQNSDDQLFCPTVAEDVAFGPLNLGRSRDEVSRAVEWALELVGLAGFEDRVTHKLSGGEKRLAALASVLAMEPDILLLDEPSLGLDHSARERLISVLKDLGQSMILIAHDADLAAAVATRGVELSGGRIHSVPPATLVSQV